MIAPRRIGLVGGIASGKSLAARWFAEQGWTVLDADKIAHGLYAAGSAMSDAIVREFGPEVRSPDGSIDRKALGAIVFAHPGRMKDLEAIVHPALRRHLAERVDRAVQEGERIVLEMALLARWPEMVARLERIVGISASPELRLARLRSRNGLAESEALDRLSCQEPEEILLSCATDVIVNDGSEAELYAALRERLSIA